MYIIQQYLKYLTYTLKIVTIKIVINIWILQIK